MKKRIRIIIVLSILLICIGIYNYFPNENIIYLGYYTKAYVSNNKIRIENSGNSFYTKKIKFYMNNEFVDGYLQVDKNNNISEYKVYNSSKELVMDIPFFFAYSGNIKIDVPKYNITTTYSELDKVMVGNILLEKGINGDIISYKKIICDLDKDGEAEEIIYVFVSDNEYAYSIFYANSDTDYIDIDMVYYKLDDQDNIRTTNFATIADLDNDGIYELIISDYTGSKNPMKYRVFKSFVEVGKEGDL